MILSLNALIDFNLLKSSSSTSTLSFLLSSFILSHACLAFVSSLHANITLAPLLASSNAVS